MEMSNKHIRRLYDNKIKDEKSKEKNKYSFSLKPIDEAVFHVKLASSQICPINIARKKIYMLSPFNTSHAMTEKYRCWLMAVYL